MSEAQNRSEATWGDVATPKAFNVGFTGMQYVLAVALFKTGLFGESVTDTFRRLVDFALEQKLKDGIVHTRRDVVDV